MGIFREQKIIEASAEIYNSPFGEAANRSISKYGSCDGSTGQREKAHRLLDQLLDANFPFEDCTDIVKAKKILDGELQTTQLSIVFVVLYAIGANTRPRDLNIDRNAQGWQMSRAMLLPFFPFTETYLSNKTIRYGKYLDMWTVMSKYFDIFLRAECEGIEDLIFEV
jgi:hypothetical protein